jgi:hypothetical protein
MKVERFILNGLHLPTNAPGKSWGVPMRGDVMMVFDVNKKNQYYMVKTIKHVVEGTRYSLEPISTLAVESRKMNGYCCYTVRIIEDAGYPIVEFFRIAEE